VATITAQMVGDLRAKTGAGMMDCKKALSESDGDMEQAIDLLRKKGLSAAAKKSGRVAAEGMIAAVGSSNCGALVEVNSETDFVAKNDAFQAFTHGVAEVALKLNPADVDALKALDFPGTGRSVGDELTHQIATIGENMNVRRFVRLESSSGVTASYIHGGGKIGVLIQLDTDKADNPRVTETARLLAMHVAAANPQYLSRNEVPADVVAREKDIMRVKAIESGKPENIVDKIIEGQISKFFGETCLLEQIYVIDTDQKVGKVVETLAKEIGGKVVLSAFARFQLGEGIEKKEDDFAAEVASMTK
jgi:elongation factor Ts